MVEAPANATPPDRWLSLAQWTALADEQNTKTFPARENFMPNGQAYVISDNPGFIPPYFSQVGIPNVNEWANTDNTVTKSITGSGELKIEFPVPVTNPNTGHLASFTKPFTGVFNQLSATRKYVFSYQIRAESGTNGVCRSFVRTYGGQPYPTAENYRTYTDVPVTVKYLLYVPVSFGTSTPVFCIDIQKTSGTTYINNVKIQPYEQADIDIHEATDFVALAYNPNWWQPATYSWPINFPFGWGGDDGFGTVYYGNVNFDNTFQSVILFAEKYVNARPYNVKPPLEPTAGSEKISLYPNPVKDMLSINLQTASENWQQLDIINMEGRIVLSQQIISGSSIIKVNTSKLQKGTYTATIKSKRGSPIAAKFIKY